MVPLSEGVTENAYSIQIAKGTLFRVDTSDIDSVRVSCPLGNTKANKEFTDKSVTLIFGLRYF